MPIESISTTTRISASIRTSACCDFLAANGFEPIEVRPRFLPLTVKSRLPTWAP